MYLMYFYLLCSRMLARKLPKTLECFMYQVCMLPVPLDLFHMLSKFPKKKNFLRKDFLDLVLFIWSLKI